MQNLADNFFNTCSSRCYDGVEDGLDTFIVYNERKKVTSSAKKKRRQGDKSLHQKLDEIRSIIISHWCNCPLQTPDGSLLDIMRNAYDILSHREIKLPKIEGNEKGSELQIEVAEFLWRDVQHDVQRFEAVKVTLHGNAEFEAVDVILQMLKCSILFFRMQGNHVFEVPDGYKMKITTGDSDF
ncbi:hypothetical protein RND71_030623 [Anisodus tanguticus]|uniref:UGP3-like C-terminal hexapeptide repeats domain-containing protein n=1 Tax=Anisodus tanguticus TaxID=243964 RepID=A0AAE1V8E7_9SOLA|nr:hypothetical protein RND71_030623 [Anisodus tanguticus]